MYTLVLVFVLQGAFGPQATSVPVVIKTDFRSGDECVEQGNLIMKDLKETSSARILSSRCYRSK